LMKTPSEVSKATQKRLIFCWDWETC
jgi:hypothetical protein